MANLVPANLLLFPIDIPQSPHLVSRAALFRAPAIFANQPINRLHREVFEAVWELETRRAAWRSFGDAVVTRWDIYLSQQRLVYQSEYSFGNAGLPQQLSTNMNNRFTNMDQRLANMNQRFTNMNDQFNNRFTAVEGQLQALLVVCLSNARVIRAPQEYEYIALLFFACMALPFVTRN